MPSQNSQNTNKQHPVPQNVMDVEFKVIGDLSMRQFVYLAVFGGGAYGAFLTLKGNVFQWPIAIILALIALGLAFVQFGDRGMDEWIINYFKAIFRPTQMVWRKEPQILSAFSYQNLAVLKQELITLAPTTSRRKLEEYLEVSTDQYQDPLELEVSKYAKMATEAFANSPVVSTTVSVADIKPLEEPQITQPQEEITQNTEEKEQPKETTYETPTLETQKNVTEIETKTEESTPVTTTQENNLITQETKKQILDNALKETPIIKPQERVQKPKETETNQYSLEAKLYELPKLKYQGKNATPDFFGDALTTDRRTGRRFTSLLPTSGEIILPIRGERVLNLDAVEESQDQIEEKTAQLKKLLEQIKSDKNYKETIVKNLIPKEEPIRKNIPEAIVKVQVEQEAKNIVEEIKAENQRLSEEINKIQTEIKQDETTKFHKDKELKLEELEERKAQAIADYEALQQKILEMQKQLANLNATNFIPQNTGYTSSVPAPVKPNVLTGIVLDKNQNPIQGAVIIVKNQKNEPERALKTNSLGQFTISNPLENGQYTIEIANAGDLGQKYEKAFVQVLGKVIPPIEFRAVQ